MAIDIDELNRRLNDPDATFTQPEAQKLIDYHVRRATNDQYQSARISSIMQEAAATTELVNTSMQALLALWDPSPMQPTLEVISSE